MIRHLNPRRRIIFLLLHTAMVITRWSSWTEEEEFFFFFYIHRMGGVKLCLRNTIDQLNHTLWYLDRRRRIFFLLLHTQDGGRKNILLLTHCGIQTEEEQFFFSSSYTGWGVKKYSTSLHQKIFAHPDTSPSINRRRRNFLLLSK